MKNIGMEVLRGAVLCLEAVKRTFWWEPLALV
jgi:hypothetical protein